MYTESTDRGTDQKVDCDMWRARLKDTNHVALIYCGPAGQISCCATGVVRIDL